MFANSPSIKYKHIWLYDVKNRYGIKIHAANFVRELRGCIAVGKELLDIDNDGIIDTTNSKKTLKELLTKIPDKGKIKIQWLL